MAVHVSPVDMLWYRVATAVAVHLQVNVLNHNLDHNRYRDLNDLLVISIACRVAFLKIDGEINMGRHLSQFVLCIIMCKRKEHYKLCVLAWFVLYKLVDVGWELRHHFNIELIIYLCWNVGNAIIGFAYVGKVYPFENGSINWFNFLFKLYA